MRKRFRPILCAWQCALLLGCAAVAGPAVAQATVTPIDLAAPAARALDEPAAPAASAPPAQAAREASAAASAAQIPAKASGAVSGNLALTLGVAAVLVAIAAMLQRARRRRRPPCSK
ncbi:hypothetical protein [Cupriavidus basilensis]|uniref:Uncharacterized protein n=1 Tax=Cupriavidus basilensis TaxID=68895 RepID=A0A0C4XZA1_9BURK|nr:hypothetical protein [Cupriavidus basilensis]AJG17852.1 hypothetical protein RR42_m0439 [Cupriavidus basilensis]